MQYDKGVFARSNRPFGYAHDRPLEEREFPDGTDLIDDDDEQSPLTLRNCPSCGEIVYEQAQQCPHCREWIFPNGQDCRSSRKWYVRGGLYVTKTLALNWVFWLAIAAAGAIIAILEIFGWLEPPG